MSASERPGYALANTSTPPLARIVLLAYLPYPAPPRLQVETIPLLVNNRDSGFVGVNMYCDDQAQVKELPLNMRASNIADCCGKPMQVRGRGEGRASEPCL